MRKKDHTVYVTEEIRKIPVIYLLDLEMSALDRLEKMVRDDSIGNFYYQEDRIYGMSKADKYFKAVCRWSCIEFLYLYEDKICLSDTV